MTKGNNLSWAIYQDGDRFIVGAKEWQTCISMTQGIAEFYCDEITKKDFPKLILRALATPAERCEELRKTYWTDARFERACADGLFGAAW